MADATQDLNETIASAVQARIETEVAAALAGDEFIGRFVSAALTQQITVEDRGTYKKRQTTFLAETLASTVRAATRAAVQRSVAAQAPVIEEAVEKMVAKEARAIAKALTKQLVDSAASPYGIKLELHYPGSGL